MTDRTDQQLADELRARLTLLGHAHVSTLADDLGETEARVADILRRMSGDVYLAAVTLKAWDRKQLAGSFPAVAQEPEA